jgi:1-acyl-sn-glycerol-3-phosphate acyltransferase
MNEPLRAKRLHAAMFLAYWRTLARYHRYEVQGLERLDHLGAALLVAYHGRPVAFDVFMLAVAMYDRYGSLPHAVFHDSFSRHPWLKWWLEGLGCVTGDDARLADVVREGGKIIVLPGGSREGGRSFRHRYRVDWGNHMGYLRLAARYRLPIVPVAAAGVDDAFLGLVDGVKLGRTVGMPARIPLWIGLGPTGLWPFSLPFPVKFRQIVGAPLTAAAEGKLDSMDKETLARYHAKVVETVQSLLDRVRRT